jgi:hypothetical protein
LQLAVKLVIANEVARNADAANANVEAAAAAVVAADDDDFPLQDGVARTEMDDQYCMRLQVTTFILPQRCFAHAVQLVVRDLIGPFGNPGNAPFLSFVLVMDQYKKLWESHVVATRWNSVYLALKDHLLTKEINHSMNRTTLNHFVDKLLKPFADATDMCQGNAATLWEQIAALDLLLSSFTDESPEHQATRDALVKRSFMLISPAVFVIAWLSPNLPRSALLEHERCVAMRYHDVVAGEAFRGLAPGYNALRGDVLKKPLTRQEFISALPAAPADASRRMQLGVEATNRAVDKLLDISISS